MTGRGKYEPVYGGDGINAKETASLWKQRLEGAADRVGIPAAVYRLQSHHADEAGSFGQVG